MSAFVKHARHNLKIIRNASARSENEIKHLENSRKKFKDTINDKYVFPIVYLHTNTLHLAENSFIVHFKKENDYSIYLQNNYILQLITKVVVVSNCFPSRCEGKSRWKKVESIRNKRLVSFLARRLQTKRP